MDLPEFENVLNSFRRKEEKFDSAIYDLINKLLKLSLPHEIKVHHLDSYCYSNGNIRFQGIFHQWGFVIPAPLPVLKHAKDYRMYCFNVDNKIAMSYTIWFDIEAIKHL
jgi:hypothetical protein